jgi:hypothetical protein
MVNGFGEINARLYRKFKPRFFSGPSYSAGAESCQTHFCLMKIPVLLRSAWAAQRSGGR